LVTHLESLLCKWALQWVDWAHALQHVLEELWRHVAAKQLALAALTPQLL
jgi:hypothetical protein